MRLKEGLERAEKGRADSGDLARAMSEVLLESRPVRVRESQGQGVGRVGLGSSFSLRDLWY